jgi:hypothetical protein
VPTTVLGTPIYPDFQLRTGNRQPCHPGLRSGVRTDIGVGQPPPPVEPTDNPSFICRSDTCERSIVIPAQECHPRNASIPGGKRQSQGHGTPTVNGQPPLHHVPLRDENVIPVQGLLPTRSGAGTSTVRRELRHAREL